jgi:hypothetical protein
LASAAGQTCTEPHYRWSEKTDTSLAGNLVTASVDVTDMLTWAPRALTAKDMCAARLGRENSVYAVTGWVRRVKLHEDDGDWHIELTSEPSAAVDSCIVVEIPAPRFGGTYQRARSELAALIDTAWLTTQGNLRTPVRLRFTGLAFFDGIHQKRTRGTGGSTHAEGHGRCNSSVRALWELHPVYKVAAPPSP